MGHDHVEMALLYDQADDLIQDHWLHITAIAHHLLSHGSADTDDLRSLCLKTRQYQG